MPDSVPGRPAGHLSGMRIVFAQRRPLPGPLALPRRGLAPRRPRQESGTDAGILSRPRRRRKGFTGQARRQAVTRVGRQAAAAARGGPEPGTTRCLRKRAPLNRAERALLSAKGAHLASSRRPDGRGADDSLGDEAQLDGNGEPSRRGASGARAHAETGTGWRGAGANTTSATGAAAPRLRSSGGAASVPRRRFGDRSITRGKAIPLPIQSAPFLGVARVHA